ncbi:SGNH/GDSL hydrolase family protein [Pseudomonas sp. ABFPK]|uniref:SGNH/GDSL hydrolase family protein n=1 Tax=Pseudomonas sp. ABFPK TaxID=1636605 RepID=UPI000778B231|nr:SGNH/GDSL hydrolase family protein [Pseudomonas sp. ABFPK]KYC26091.1 hypothetical protein WM94_04475 [Pseudomonas sp. ABFPK]
MRYNTGNPVGTDGSSSPFDLHDNSANIDLFANGDEPAYPDRLGQLRKSISGMESEFDSAQAERAAEFDASQQDKEDRFNDFLVSSAYQFIGEYASGLVVSEYNQIFQKDGQFYRASPSTALPYTTTGTWASESSKFIPVGDAALRQELASGNTGSGAEMVEFAGRTVEAKLRDNPSPRDQPYSAVGDGVANDSAAFTAFEAVVTGRVVDLSGRTHLVNSAPKKNAYINGRFKIAGFTRNSSNISAFSYQPPFVHRFGGQLSKLKVSLSNPLEQITSVAFIGDSITWGVGTGEESTSSPNTALLTAARDDAGSYSWVNILKKYIGERYAFGAVQVNSNWAGSPSGQAIAQFSYNRFVFPRRGDFTVTQAAGGSMSITEQYSTSIEGTRAVMILGNGNAGVESSHSIKFKFTGFSFVLGFTCQESTASYYELLINGVSQGVFSTHAGVDGFVNNTRNNYRTHTFAKVVNADIEIKTRRNGETGLREIYLQSIKFNKVINLINQGIIGVATRWYINFNMGAFTDQYGSTCDYAICQLGTNDRIFQSNAPGGMNQFVYDLKEFLDTAPAATTKILMCANPAVNEDPTVYSFNMQDVRGVITRVAKERGLDMIDNYAAMSALDPSIVASDGLHPNILGHSLIARNIINALESA